jgi:hypothetical protein
MNMRGTFTVTIDFVCASLECCIEYEATPGERPIRYYRDGSGYPGSPDEVELVSVAVELWVTVDEERRRGTHWVWSALDEIARNRVEEDWEFYFRARCLREAEKISQG